MSSSESKEVMSFFKITDSLIYIFYIQITDQMCTWILFYLKQKCKKSFRANFCF